MMEIRPTELKDLPLVMEIYDYARAGTNRTCARCHSVRASSRLYTTYALNIR